MGEKALGVSRSTAILWSVFVFILLATLCQGQPCTTRGWFGDNCQYKCHCTGDNCDFTTGECTGGVACIKGWFGPACQYVDLMTTMTTGTSWWLYDGNDGTCNDEQTTTVTVQFNETVYITWLRLYFKESGNQEASIDVVSCKNKKTTNVSDRTLDIHCDLDTLVQQVRLTGPGVASLCSVYISGGRNVALKQPTTQSSTYIGGASTISSNAVDGDRNGQWWGGSCTQTQGGDSNAYWNVAFRHHQIINRYVLFNRKDDIPERLLKFKLTSYTEDDRQVFNYQDQKTQPQDIYTVIPDVTSTSPVSKVTITPTYIVEDRDDTTPVLTLCEVEFYGDTVCPKGNYGRECEGSCDYCRNQECFVSTGGCTDGCANGFIGYKCQDRCPSTYYGKDCAEHCSTNCKDSLCNNVDGVCNDCIPGKMGDMCNQDCPATFYGSGCKQNCSMNCVDRLCDKANGHCNQCPAGRTGDLCEEDCQATFYGQDCKDSCSTDCTDKLCDNVNGACHQCVPGKTGKLEMCSEDCPQTTHGQDCLQKCNTTCLDKNCHPVSGVCIQCPPGKMGDQCGQVCAAGKYGQGCKETCSKHCLSPQDTSATSCEPVNGTCVLGCMDGYSGSLCVAEAATGDGGSSSFPIGAVVGAVLGALLIAAIIVGVLFWRRRRTKNDGLITANKAHKKQASKSDSSASSELNGISNPYNTIETDNSAQPLTAVVTSGSTESKPTTKPKPPVKPKKTAEGNDTSSATQKPGKPGSYYNAIGSASSTSIPVRDLDNFIKSHDKDFFRKHFSEIPTNDAATTADGQSQENKAKNRYKNICAYDHSRVHLKKDKDKKYGDYINASNIEGYKQQEKFIASQGPTKVMIEDFVRMLWEQRTEKLVMLTNLVEEGKMKCEQYWPEDSDLQMGDIKVTLTTTEVFADYTIRRLRLSKEGEGSQLLTQFHFTSWPDKGVPTTPWGLVDFEQRVAWDPTDKPIVVHCSAGVGRTGTFIALRNLMKEADDTKSIDVFTTVKKLRHDRVNMVQTSEQYEFLHQAAQVAIMCIGTTVTSSDIQDRIAKLESTSTSGQTMLQDEFNAICMFCAEDDDEVTDSQSDPQKTKNSAYENSEAVLKQSKDRLRNVPAKESYRAQLTWENDYMGDYINAVLVPSFRTQNQQLLTQLPLPSTVTDFWRLVTQYKVTMVVAFELDFKATDSTIGTYLPPKPDESLDVPLFKITTSPVSHGEMGDVQTVTIATDGQKKQKKTSPDFQAEEHKVVHISCKKTKLEPADMLTLIKQIRSTRGGDGRIVYMCRNGASFSGLLCVLTLLLDRLDHDLRLTVPLVVGTIKSIRPQVIPTLDQYRLLYKELHMYNESNNVYTNFGDPKPGDAAENKSTQGSGDDEKEKGTIYANT